MNHVFVISAPRSGSTWLIRALSAHPEIYATELRANGGHADFVVDDGAARPRLRITLDRYVDALLEPHAWQSLGPSRNAVHDQLTAAIYGTIAGHALAQTGKGVFLDKVTPYLGTSDQVLTSITRLFPQARIIMLVRDGRDVAVSGVMHWLKKRVSGTDVADHQRKRQAFFLNREASRLDRFFTDAEIETWARHWREPIDAMAAHGPAQPLVVRYEDMSRDLTNELHRICTRLGIDASARTLEHCAAESTFERMSGGRKRGDNAPGEHVRNGVVGDWKSYFTAADAEVFDRVAGACLIEQGYEPDEAWAARLPQEMLAAAVMRPA
jgi:hypothetical protein